MNVCTGSRCVVVVDGLRAPVHVNFNDLDGNDLDLPVQPIVDGGLVSDPFLPDEPAELLRKGRNCSLQKVMELFNPFI